jgi:geranylgeranyl pyrophosphate synthase
LPAHSLTEPTLARAIQHALKHSGSMVRARVCYLLARNFNLGETASMDLALSLELFHTASLLFDDLPCMDNAQERRGAPCTHTMFGEAAAILSALALINKAYNFLWSAMREANPKVRTEATEFVEQCLGVAGILNGQSLDLHFSGTQSSGGSGRCGGRVMRVALGKTVSLIKMTLVLPALVGGASRAECKLLNRLSVFWGLAYQVMDDLKDVLAVAEQTGKTTHRDGLLGRPNLALAEGPVRTTRLLTRLISLGDSALEEASQHVRIVDCLKELRRKIASELSPLQAANVLP